MPTFKVTLHIKDGLTLGHVLMTKGVELIHIIESPNTLKISEKKKFEPKLLMHEPQRKPYKQFKHPSGKPMIEFLSEYLDSAPKQTATWAEMGDLIKGLGFGKSSVNNAVGRMLKAEVIEKISPGVYKLVKKK